jgi:hypothetical protein
MAHGKSLKIAKNNQNMVAKLSRSKEHNRLINSHLATELFTTEKLIHTWICYETLAMEQGAGHPIGSVVQL